MIFIFAVLACIVVEGSAADISLRSNKIVEGSAADISLRCNKIFYKLDTKPVQLSTTKPVFVTLKKVGVPENADEVVVFSYIQTGYLQGSRPNFVVLDLLNNKDDVTDQRKLFYKTDDQTAWSYNSENIVFPLEPGVSSCVRAQFQGFSSDQHFAAYVQLTGYYITHCKVTS